MHPVYAKDFCSLAWLGIDFGERQHTSLRFLCRCRLIVSGCRRKQVALCYQGSVDRLRNCSVSPYTSLAFDFFAVAAIYRIANPCALSEWSSSMLHRKEAMPVHTQYVCICARCRRHTLSDRNSAPRISEEALIRFGSSEWLNNRQVEQLQRNNVKPSTSFKCVYVPQSPKPELIEKIVRSEMSASLAT